MILSTLHRLGKAGVTGEAGEARLAPLPRWLTRVFATGLGTGYLPRAHGTAASALWIALWVALVPRSRKAEWRTAMGVNLFSVPLSAWGERIWGHDPGRVTVDEFAGQAIALCAIPNRRWPWLLAAFALFRLFDVWKLPFTRRRIEPIGRGIGTTLDDTLAGILAALVLLSARAILPKQNPRPES